MAQLLEARHASCNMGQTPTTAEKKAPEQGAGAGRTTGRLSVANAAGDSVAPPSSRPEPPAPLSAQTETPENSGGPPGQSPGFSSEASASSPPKQGARDSSGQEPESQKNRDPDPAPPNAEQKPEKAKAAPTKPKALYVLRLESGKFYVGTSGNPAARFDAHKKGTGAAWTAKYPPLEMIKTEPDKTRQDEDAEVKRLMLEHGIDNVRGGTYTAVNLPAYQRAALAKELQHAADKCFACGAVGHYVKGCPNTASVTPKQPKGPRQAAASEKPEELRRTAEALRQTAEKLAQAADRLAPEKRNDSPDAETPPEPPEATKAAMKAKNCSRCGRKNHQAANCYAKTDVFGGPLVAL